jgi:hypothetical protein
VEGVWDVVRSLLRLNSVRVFATLIICWVAVWAFVSFETHREEGVPSNPPAPVVTQATVLKDLPEITKSGEFPISWAGIEGLNASTTGEQAISPGQPVLALVAIPTPGGHYLYARISSLQKDTVYAVGVWLKPGSQALAFLQVTDLKSTNYGLLFCDLGDRRIFNVQRDVVSRKIEPGRDGWLKLTLVLRTADGVLDVTLGFVDTANSTVFKADGQSALTFGGIETIPQN